MSSRFICEEQANSGPIQETHQNTLVLTGEVAAEKTGTQLGQGYERQEDGAGNRELFRLVKVGRPFKADA
jgi:hypothetical protein